MGRENGGETTAPVGGETMENGRSTVVIEEESSTYLNKAAVRWAMKREGKT